jgi:hypothetical protein
MRFLWGFELLNKFSDLIGGIFGPLPCQTALTYTLPLISRFSASSSFLLAASINCFSFSVSSLSGLLSHSSAFLGGAFRVVFARLLKSIS